MISCLLPARTTKPFEMGFNHKGKNLPLREQMFFLKRKSLLEREAKKKTGRLAFPGSDPFTLNFSVNAFKKPLIWKSSIVREAP